MATALSSIIKEAKHLKRKYPHRFDHLKPPDRWSKGYVKQASAIYAKKHHGKSPVGKKRKVRARRLSAVTPKPKPGPKPKPRAVVRKKQPYVIHKVIMAGTRRRHRSVGKTDTGMMLPILIGLGALYFLTRKPAASQSPIILPPITQTSNYTRNQQSQNIIAYATAAGLALSAIASLIDKLNKSSDQEVQNIYDDVNTTGDVGVYV